LTRSWFRARPTAVDPCATQRHPCCHGPRTQQLPRVLAALPACALAPADARVALSLQLAGPSPRALRARQRPLAFARAVHPRRFPVRLDRPLRDREEPACNLHLPIVEPGGGLSHVVAVADRAARAGTRESGRRTFQGCSGPLNGVL